MNSSDLRVGQGIDLHRFTAGDRVVLGGITIPYHQSLEGHSDADVLTHAVMDALLGAAGLPDIGHFFPNTDPQYKGANSMTLLSKVVETISAAGFSISNIDCTLLAEEPKISPYIPAMKLRYSEVLSIEQDRIGIKASTTERLGAIGRKEGVFASAVVLLLK